MKAMAPLHYLAVLALSFTCVLAQNETAWSAVVITMYGDRVPLLSPSYSVLTPLGAQQMFSVGALIRDRYIAPSNESLDNGNYTIAGISTYEMDVTQVMAYTTGTGEVWMGQSAQAFMSGLYPPSSSNGSIPSATLANGTSIESPLGGTQYMQIFSASSNDPAFVSLSGMDNCPNLDSSVENYLESSDYISTITSTKSFYQSLSQVFTSVSVPYSLSFADAYNIWDYISYEVIHDNNTASAINSSSLDTTRHLADSFMWNLYGDKSADNGIRVVAGRTLAAQVLDLLGINVDTNGGTYKLTPLFTSFEPMMSLASLLGLNDLYTEFYGMPNLGSSMIFEMYSNSTNSTSYPVVSDLRVRFMFRNGTSSPTNLATYPIFGNDRDSMDMSLGDFALAMENIAIGKLVDWCTICGSEVVFCLGAMNEATGSSSSSPTSIPSSSNQVAPVVAGVIGALVALVVAALALLATMLIGGVRFRRERTKKRTKLGGFKGSEKLAR